MTASGIIILLLAVVFTAGPGGLLLRRRHERNDRVTAFLRLAAMSVLCAFSAALWLLAVLTLARAVW